MKLIISLFLFSLAMPVYGADLTRLDLSMAFVPPHNEPVIGSYVARYKAEGNIGVRFAKYFTFDGDVRAWGVNEWRTMDVVGHGVTAWGNSDWSVKKMSYDFTVKLGVDIYDPLQAFIEHQSTPYDTQSRYYWMAGLRLRLR